MFPVVFFKNFEHCRKKYVSVFENGITGEERGGGYEKKLAGEQRDLLFAEIE